MVVGGTLDGCGIEEGEGSYRHDDSVMAGAVTGGSAVEVVLDGNGGESVAVEVTTMTPAMVLVGEHYGG